MIIRKKELEIIEANGERGIAYTVASTENGTGTISRLIVPIKYRKPDLDKLPPIQRTAVLRYIVPEFAAALETTPRDILTSPIGTRFTIDRTMSSPRSNR